MQGKQQQQQTETESDMERVTGETGETEWENEAKKLH